jgi:hypothetical protein
MINWAAPGAFVGTNGLTDVQTVDATGFNGSLEIGENISYQGFAKALAGATGMVNYSIALGNQSNGFNVPGYSASFNSVNLAIDANVAASGNFFETITGGTANDMINVSVVSAANVFPSSSSQSNNPTGLANNGAWILAETSLANLVINTGAGNNTVIFNGGGAAQITTGAGNDTVYIDNTGGTISGDGSLSKTIYTYNNMKEIWVSNVTTATSFPTLVPTAVETTKGLGATAQVETSYWQGVNVASGTTNTETVATSVGDLQGVTVKINTSTPGATGIVTSQLVAADVQTTYNDYVAGLAAHTNSAGKVWDAVNLTLTETFTDPGLNVITVTVGSDYIIKQTAIDLQQGSNTLTSATSGVTNVYGTGGVTNAITTLGAAAATEQQTVTWQPLKGTGASETIGGIIVTDTDTTGTTSVTSADIATQVYNAFLGGNTGHLGAGVAVAGGKLYTDTVDKYTIFIPTASATTWAVSAPVVAGTNLLTYGTTGVYAGSLLPGSSTAGTSTGLIDTTVSLDVYGNLTTHAGNQTGAIPHIFTGSGETVTINYEGYSVTSAPITPATSNAAATYTSADVNKAIAAAVNNDPVMSKLLHVTQGSAAESLIFSSLVDGLQNVPKISFNNTSGIGTATSTSLLTSDGVALNQYSTLYQGSGDGVTTGSKGVFNLLGNDSVYVNNSNITDNGSGTAANTYNVIDLSSNSTVAAVAGSQVGSKNTVTLKNVGQTIITNYKVALDTITTDVTHSVVLNAVDDGVQLAYIGTTATSNAGALNVLASSLGLTTAAGILEGSTLATATGIAGATTGKGIVVVENAATHTTSIYLASDIANLNTTSVNVLEATLVGVTPANASIHLV